MLTKVRFHPAWGITFLVLGSILLVLSLLTEPGINLITTAILLILGILYLVNPMLTVDEKIIQLRSPAGVKGKAHHYREEPVRIEGVKIWVGDKRLRVSKWMAHPKDYERLMRLLHQQAEKGDLSSHLVDG